MPFNTELQNASINTISNILGGVDRNGLDFLRAGPQDTTMSNGIVSPLSLMYTQTNRTYNGTDCMVAIVYNENVVMLGNVETISYSIHREKMPVRTLGKTYPKDFVRGQRTIAGSIIFVQFDESPLYILYRFFNKQKLENAHRYSSPLVDELPPFDIMLIFTNEYGYTSIIRIYGVEITDEGAAFSINDIYTENVMQFIAKDIDPMVSSGQQGKHQSLLFEKQMQGKIIDEHYASMLKYAEKLENDLANADRILSETRLDTRYAKLPVNVSGIMVDAQFRTKHAKERNVGRVEQAAINKKWEDQRKLILVELQKTYDNIKNYEKTKMTYDMNSATHADYTSDAVFGKI